MMRENECQGNLEVSGQTVIRNRNKYYIVPELKTKLSIFYQKLYQTLTSTLVFLHVKTLSYNIIINPSLVRTFQFLIGIWPETI